MEFVITVTCLNKAKSLQTNYVVNMAQCFLIYVNTLKEFYYNFISVKLNCALRYRVPNEQVFVCFMFSYL